MNEVTGAGVVSLSVGSWHLILATEMQVYANLENGSALGGKQFFLTLPCF